MAAKTTRNIIFGSDNFTLVLAFKGAASSRRSQVLKLHPDSATRWAFVFVPCFSHSSPSLFRIHSASSWPNSWKFRNRRRWKYVESSLLSLLRRKLCCCRGGACLLCFSLEHRRATRTNMQPRFPIPQRNRLYWMQSRSPIMEKRLPRSSKARYSKLSGV